MRLLVLGGTVFVGWHIVSEALRRGHGVTLFNRGQSDPGAFAEVERIRGDRATDDLEALRGRRWDAAIDTSGYDPGVVGRSARLLAGAVDRYVFLSSLAVYADRRRRGLDEEAEVVSVEERPVAGRSADHRDFPEAPGPGPSKLACERAVDEALPGRALHLRMGLVSGHRDVSDRFPYWPLRTARGGEVLAPGRPDAPVQVMRGADFARFTVDLLERAQAGVYNVAGRETTMEAVLARSRALTGASARFTWVGDAFLVARGVKMYVDLPLWVSAEFAGVNSCGIEKALGAGFRPGPLDDLVEETIAWSAHLARERPPRAGLSASREAELLAEWRAGRAAAADPA